MKLVKAKVIAASLIGLAMFGTQALAQTTLFGAPTLTLLKTMPSSARISVHAGEGGAPVGFVVEWMKKSDFDVSGWPALGAAAGHGEFTGTPTWVVVGNAGDFSLTQSQWQAVQIGELFDETGVGTNSVAELEPGTEYAVRAYAMCTTGSEATSVPSATMFVTTAAQVQNCTFTIGYWKTHPEAWPATSLTLGTVNYTAAQLLSILNEPAGGNGLLILAHQLIAAKLSILNGADASAVATDIANADAMIGGLVCPPVGSDALPSASVNAIATDLDNYNNGLIGPGHCATTPAHVQTWGAVKATYRR